MRVAVFGASGFIGSHLTAALSARGDEVRAGSLRDPSRAAQLAAGCDAIANLSGEPIAQRWNAAAKERIEASRVALPRAFFEALAVTDGHPKVFVSASAVGYYGTSETRTFTEADPAGSGFLARVCERWEMQARRAAELGMRVACVRTGLALGAGGGALARLLWPFRLGLGGKIASGHQWYSWIHVDDLVGIYLMALDGAEGTLNATAPNPVRNEAFAAALGAALHRPTPFPVPAFAVRALLGEGSTVLLEGQRVLPERTQRLGYAFRFPALEPALAQILR